MVARPVSNHVSIGESGPVRSRTPFGAPVLRDQGPDRPAGHGKADTGLGPYCNRLSTICIRWGLTSQ
jgi:hypothetical protein